ncbi:MAG: hypothetical protein M0D57_04270 [Sphingobacteriales bacterium JAD_PAG50586_3]|nr:MAG: hypothetical protein M0D57_04270 [Sphingobacteriales bacterium JAD_PAG50586_3]
MPDETVLSEIQKEVRNYGTSFMTVFVHDISISNDEYFICIDHNTIDHSNYSDSDFQKDVDNLDFLLQAINKNPLIKNLKHIRFV